MVARLGMVGRRGVVGGLLGFFFILLVESSGIVWLVRRFLLFLLFLLFLEECPVDVVTETEVQHEQEDCQTDEECPVQLHTDDCALLPLLRHFIQLSDGCSCHPPEQSSDI